MGRWIALVFLWLTGWREEGEVPQAKKFVLIAAPHTSNWDLAYLLALAAYYRVQLFWMGKHVLFRPPLGWVMRPLGGIPVVRHERRSMVSQMVDQFGEREQFVLVVPTEATRSRAEIWKSGFYHIANDAGVPIVCGYLDYARKRGGFGPAVQPTGNIPADMETIRGFYADKIGRYPEKFGPIVLREELEANEVANA